MRACKTKIGKLHKMTIISARVSSDKPDELTNPTNLSKTLIILKLKTFFFRLTPCIPLRTGKVRSAEKRTGGPNTLIF